MDTRCLAALCIGIEEYQDAGHFVNLPNASRDAQDFSQEMLRRGFQERNLISLVGHVTESALTRSISSFLELVENDVSQRDIHLVVVFVAAHGMQLQSGELPAIWASDSDGICDLDALLVKPLDMMKGGKIKAWFVIDTCRENRSINTWTGLAEDNAYRRRLWRSQTDFQLLFACDRGRAASDQHSMTKELISALRDQHNDLEAVCKKAQASVQEQSRGRQRPWISSRGDFSGIFLPTERPSWLILCLRVEWVQVFLRGTGCVIALFVVMLWEMLEISIPWHECDRRGPKVIAVFLDLCVFRQSLTLDWLTVQALETRRRSLLSLLAKNPRLTALWVIWWVCKIRSECAVGEGLLANKAQILSSLGYNVLNASFLSSSIVQVLRSVALQPEFRTCFHWLARDFLRGFLPTAFIGEFFVMWRCHRSAAREEFILYILCLWLGWICSTFAWIISTSIRLQGEENTRDQVAVRKFEQASLTLCVVKFVWCCAFTAQTLLWCSSSEEHRTLGTKYHSLTFVVERVCAFLTLSLLKNLAKLYSGLNDLPH